jgi:hypothetical protein
MPYSDATSNTVISPGSTVISPGSTVISDGNLEGFDDQNLEGFEFDNFTPDKGIKGPQQKNNNKHLQVLTEVSPSVSNKRTLREIHGNAVEKLNFDAEVGKRKKPFDENALQNIMDAQSSKRRNVNKGGKKSRKKKRKTLKRNFKRRRNTKRRRTKK